MVSKIGLIDLFFFGHHLLGAASSLSKPAAEDDRKIILQKLAFGMSRKRDNLKTKLLSNEKNRTQHMVAGRFAKGII